MLIETAVFFAAGIVLGILAGLIPGLHPNTVLITMMPLLLFAQGHSHNAIIALVVSLSICNTVVNFIPTIFLGAPEPETCLSVLPGHKFLLRGRGYEALFLMVMGSVSAMMLTMIALPFILWFIPLLYANIHSYMHWLLLFALALLLYGEKGKQKRLYSIFIFLVTGLAGVMILPAFPGDQALFPALSGLFGIPIIMTSMTQMTTFPRQRMKARPEWKWVKGGLAGWIAGMLVGILPGIGSAQAGVLASRMFRGKDRDFLVALGGIATSNITFTFIVLHSIGKTRSGAAWALSEVLEKITLNEVLFIMLIALSSCFLSGILTLKLGKSCLSLMEKINYRKLNVSVLILMVFLLIIFSGIYGMIIAALCAVLGLACIRMGVKKMYLMGFLMLPTILYYIV